MPLKDERVVDPAVLPMVLPASAHGLDHSLSNTYHNTITGKKGIQKVSLWRDTERPKSVYVPRLSHKDRAGPDQSKVAQGCHAIAPRTSGPGPVRGDVGMVLLSRASHLKDSGIMCHLNGVRDRHRGNWASLTQRDAPDFIFALSYSVQCEALSRLSPRGNKR